MFKHLNSIAPAHLLKKVCFSLVFTPPFVPQTVLYACIQDMLKPHQPANVSVDMEGFY